MQKLHNVQWCRSLLSIGGIICYFTPILPYFQHWRGRTSTTILFRCGNVVETKNKMQMEHFFSPNSGEDQKKKRSSSKIEHIFPPNSGEDQKKKKKRSSARIDHLLFSPHLRSDGHPFKMLGGMQMWTILKLLGEIQPRYPSLFWHH